MCVLIVFLSQCIFSGIKTLQTILTQKMFLKKLKIYLVKNLKSENIFSKSKYIISKNTKIHCTVLYISNTFFIILLCIYLSQGLFDNPII